MSRNIFFLLVLLASIAGQPLFGLCIAEKRQNLNGKKVAHNSNDLVESSLKELNQELNDKRQALIKLTTETDQLYKKMLAENTDPAALATFLNERKALIDGLRQEIAALEANWKDLASQMGPQEMDGIWHQPDTSIGQIVIDYGSQDYIYLMPPEIAGLKIHVSSQLSVPKAAWNEILDLILSSYGIGIKQLNGFVRQLYFLRLNQSGLTAICDNPDKLQTFSQDARIGYVFYPPPTEVKRVFQFMEKFIPQEQMTCQLMSNSILVVGFVREIVEIMKIYDFLLTPKQAQEYRIIALQKGQSEEIAQILHSLFDGEAAMRSFNENDREKPMPMPFFPSDATSGFRVIAMKHPAQSLFLIGKHDQIEKACQIVHDIESRIGEVQEKTVCWYACKHSEAEELAKVLSQVYTKMITVPQAFQTPGGLREKIILKRTKENTLSTKEVMDDSSYLTPPIVNPQPVEPTDLKKRMAGEINDNFIVDPKTNSIVMVVEAYLIDQLKELLKKLDVPKKMVQIDVLLFEKRVIDTNSFGMNLLRLGDAATKKHRDKLTWNVFSKRHPIRGILQYSISRGTGGFLPAYDLIFNFLLSQQDVQINANPSVVTVNQTPTKIAIVEEISLNTGVYEVPVTNETSLKNAFTRAQYGITIQLTPTIHAKSDISDEPDEKKFITLVTDINFDTTAPSDDNRPDVTRRNIKNEVRIADGETIILGGLRRKICHNDQHSIPFLGELPGIGKFFSTTTMTDNNTEMFIFITPKIIPDPSEEYHAMRKRELLLRPGDIPEFLAEVEIAKEEECKGTFERSIKLLFGKPNGCAISNKSCGGCEE